MDPMWPDEWKYMRPYDKKNELWINLGISNCSGNNSYRVKTEDE